MKMPTKIKNPQVALPNEVQDRDLFRTPRYATELLIPYIPARISSVWECAAGDDMMISTVLTEYGFDVISTDLKSSNPKVGNWNFFDADITHRYINSFDCIITNPPFSLKREFFNRCIEIGKPFALLIPADYSLWVIDAVRKHGCQKIVITRRVDYITPFCINRINKQYELNFTRVTEIPNEYLVEDAKLHSSQFHSMWITKGFGLDDIEVYAELSNKDKEKII